MRAIWITHHGGLDALEVRESPDPVPLPGQVRIATRAVGLNYAEVMARRGTYPDAPRPPCVLGYEGAGEIDRVGPGVDPGLVGRRVVYMSRFGGQASHVCVDTDYSAPIPPDMGFEDAAALPVNFITAFHVLERVWRLREGDRVLVHMAAGGVGTAVLQMCRHVPDVVTFGTAAADKFDFVRAQGCTHPIDYRTEDYAEVVRRLTDGQGVDLVLDPLGGMEQWKKGYSLLRPGGLLVIFGLAQVVQGGRRAIIGLLRELKKDPPFTPLSLLDDNRGVAGVNIGHLWEHAQLVRREGLAVIDLCGRGRIRPHMGSRYPFSRVAEAHEELESGRNAGKILLIPD
ncbi:MAG: zinc-binding dehydrogenase [Polyangiaceae bacterium]|nr:zinc-binding dehydrogenase [Polyangiaceae bacterium]